MRREDAIDKYGVYYTIDTDCWTIQEHLGKQQYEPTTKDDAELSFNFSYWYRELTDIITEYVNSCVEEDNCGVDDLQYFSYENIEVTPLGYSDQSSSQKTDSLIIDATNFLHGMDHIYHMNNVQDNIDKMRALVSEHRLLSSEIRGEGGDCNLENYACVPEYVYDYLPEELNVSSTCPVDSDNAYAVSVESDGNVSIGGVSLVFNGVRSYLRISFDGNRVGIDDNRILLPMYKVFLSHKYIGDAIYTDHENSNSISEMFGSLAMLDASMDVCGNYSAHDAYQSIQICYSKSDVIKFLSDLDVADQHNRFNTFPAYSQLGEL